LHGWAKALEYRDGETAGHSQRVTELSVAVGQALGLEAEDMINIRRGSYLHDIGKMAIPDNILLKPGVLTDDEWKIMKLHPLRSREFLAGIPFLQGAIPIAYSHHERWDGTGYPEGLKGREIPLLARIFAVVDNWDALTSDRPYRKAWTDEKTIAYLKENAGRMFDPQILEAFLSIISNKGKGQ
jgi:HD-GYP domain-containing protein (c-di-GMP phosphodiesterase class II)